MSRGGSARARVDGRSYGFTPVVVRVAPGSHAVSVEGAGDAFLPSQLSLDVVGGDTANAVFTARGWTPTRPAAVDSAPAATPTATPAATPPAAGDSAASKGHGGP